MLCGVYDLQRSCRNLEYSGTLLGRATGEGESPVHEMLEATLAWYLSRAGHEKSCLKLGGPPSKAKYEMATDREEVP